MGESAKKLEVAPEEALMKLEENYDDYRFTSPLSDIYNPSGLLNVFADGKFGPYWFGNGTPMYPVKVSDKLGVKPSGIGRRQLRSSIFNVSTETMTDTAPLLY